MCAQVGWSVCVVVKLKHLRSFAGAGWSVVRSLVTGEVEERDARSVSTVRVVGVCVGDV